MLRFRRIVHEDQVYTPIVTADGRMLGPKELGALALVRTLTRSRRYVRAVLFTDEKPRPNQPGFDLTNGWFFIPHHAPVLLGGTELIIGVIENAEMLIDDHYREVRADIRLDNSQLADIVWRGVKDKIISGCCCTLENYFEGDDGRFVRGTVARVALGAEEANCLPRAKVIDYWVDDRDSAARAEDENYLDGA